MNDKTEVPKVMEVQLIECPEEGPWEITSFDVIVGFVVAFLFAYIVAGIKEWRKEDETS